MLDITPDIVRDHTWEFYGAFAYPLYITIYPPFYTHGFQERFGTPVDILNTYEGKRVHWFMRADHLTELAIRALPIFLTKKWAYYDNWQREDATFVEAHKKLLSTDLTKLNDTELKAAARTYREAFGGPFVTNNVIEGLSYYFQHHLKDLLIAEGVAPERCSELIDLYGQAARPSYLKQCADAYRRATTTEEKAAVLKEYGYIYNNYAGVSTVTETDLETLARSTYSIATPTTTPDISERAQALLTVVQILATMQDVRKGGFLQMVEAAHRLALAWSERTGIPMETIRYATWEDLEHGISDAEKLAARAYSTMYWTLDGVVIKTGEDAKPIIEAATTHVFATEDAVQEIKGICASKGTVRGRAVIIFDPSEFNRVQPGDILFTMMTRPEFLPVMHKAAAFVCDEGGLTSHAAIVAREMKKPCVIATRVGTRTFKDGDMVEVDATAGIVRKV